MDPANVPVKVKVHSFSRSWDNSGYLKTLGSPWIHRSRSSKVTDFGTNRKRVCDFLLVRHSNLGPILHCFGDIAGFLCFWVTPPLFHPNLRVFPLHHITQVGVSPHIRLKLFGHEIIFAEFQPMWSRYLNVTDRQIDCGITTLCIALRRNKLFDSIRNFEHLHSTNNKKLGYRRETTRQLCM